MKPWKASNTEHFKYSGIIEFRDNKGEYQYFEVIELDDRICFGTVCNAGFLESGYILKEEHENLIETLQELHSDLESYYNNGKNSVSRIVCNERM